MNKVYRLFLIMFTLFMGISSCKDDDTPYTALEIETSPDLGEVLQLESLVISIFSNDSNIPANGILTLENPTTGSIELIENSPNTVADNQVEYTSLTEFTGIDSFSYTICDESGSNCKTETATITVRPFSPVNGDLTQIPYAKLSEYNFFQGNIANLDPVNGVVPYEPISSLFSDYAHKKRFVWMPFGSKASYLADGEVLNFPVGTILIKSFYYENVKPNNETQIIETRLMIKRANDWTFAEYLWNEDQTDAFLDTIGDGAFKLIEWEENGIERSLNYRIPSTSECFTCHKSNANNKPIGLKPQNLNTNYNYVDGTENQLQKWIELGYLENNLPQSIETVVDYNDSSQSLDLRIRSYFDINCASCHSDEGHCNYRSMRFSFDENAPLASRGVCITPDTFLPGLVDAKIIKPGDPENSVIYFRLNNIEEQYRMPLLGRRLIHDEGVALVEEWINSLTNICD